VYILTIHSHLILILPKKDIIFSSLLSAIESYHKRHAHRRTVKLAVKRYGRDCSFSVLFPLSYAFFCIIKEKAEMEWRMEKLTRMFERVISICIDSMLAILVVVVLIFMGKAIFMISTTLFPLSEAPHLSFLIEEIATLFILLEIILMLLRYMKDGHHIPVRYLILISITAILRELLLTQGMANDALFFALAIFVLVLVLLVLQKINAFQHTQEKDH